MFYAPVMDISEKYTLLQSAMAGGERVFKLLDTEEHIPDTGSVAVEGSIRGDIAFEHVSFSYIRGEPILKDLSFSVKAGEMIAIVGYTGVINQLLSLGANKGIKNFSAESPADIAARWKHPEAATLLSFGDI
jgi:ABC-type multidrug transport system fused ATPase/permease subunit